MRVPIAFHQIYSKGKRDNELHILGGMMFYHQSPSRAGFSWTYMKTGYDNQRSSRRVIWDDLHMGNQDLCIDILTVSAVRPLLQVRQLTYCCIG
jgi:hypothetical protein